MSWHPVTSSLIPLFLRLPSVIRAEVRFSRHSWGKDTSLALVHSSLFQWQKRKQRLWKSNYCPLHSTVPYNSTVLYILLTLTLYCPLHSTVPYTTVLYTLLSPTTQLSFTFYCPLQLYCPLHSIVPYTLLFPTTSLSITFYCPLQFYTLLPLTFYCPLHSTVPIDSTVLYNLTAPDSTLPLTLLSLIFYCPLRLCSRPSLLDYPRMWYC